MHITQNFFQPRRSRIYFGYLVFTHIFALFSLLFVMRYWALLFLPIICVSFFFYYCRVEKTSALEYDKKTEWVLHLFSGVSERAALLPSSVMMRYFLVLHFQCIHTGEKKSLVLFADSFLENDFRSLRRCVKSGYF